ncbi:MAG: 4Fe-4S dicluster domain-containing protein [Desulfitobacterium hafniense]|nr:4Fe-4S dicluster domain-containing protein [Desulfitobacterium hafniense]
MPIQLHIRYDLCTGCRACQINCALKREGQFWLESAAIKVRQLGPGPIDIPIFCHQCSDHPCVIACPTKALSNDDNGIVQVDSELCYRGKGINCLRCFKACKGQTIHFHPKSNLPLFCDLCNGTPECAKVCAAGALAVTNNLSFDGKHYAEPPDNIASELCLRLYGRRNVI